MPTARIRSLATQLSIGLPDDNDPSETERAKWVWQLSVLERSVTIRALGYVKAAQADGKWDETAAALGDTGRFTVPWMAAARAAKRAAATAAAAAAAAWTGFEIIPILDVVARVMTTVPAADVNAVAKQFAYATAGLHGVALAGTTPGVWKNAGGMALQRVMRERNHGLDKLPVLPAAVPGTLSALPFYMFPPDSRAAPAAATTTTAPTPPTPPAGGQMSFDAASLAALRDLASLNVAVTGKPDPIVLGHSKVANGGTLRRPEFFSVGDVSTFEAHEARLFALSGMPKGEQTSLSRRLCTSCRCMLAIC